MLQHVCWFHDQCIKFDAKEWYGHFQSVNLPPKKNAIQSLEVHGFCWFVVGHFFPEMFTWAMKKNLGYSLYMGDYTTQLYRDYNKLRIPINHPVEWNVIRVLNAAHFFPEIPIGWPKTSCRGFFWVASQGVSLLNDWSTYLAQGNQWLLSPINKAGCFFLGGVGWRGITSGKM